MTNHEASAFLPRAGGHEARYHFGSQRTACHERRGPTRRPNPTIPCLPIMGRLPRRAVRPAAPELDDKTVRPVSGHTEAMPMPTQDHSAARLPRASQARLCWRLRRSTSCAGSGSASRYAPGWRQRSRRPWWKWCPSRPGSRQRSLPCQARFPATRRIGCWWPRPVCSAPVSSPETRGSSNPASFPSSRSAAFPRSGLRSSSRSLTRAANRTPSQFGAVMSSSYFSGSCGTAARRAAVVGVAQYVSHFVTPTAGSVPSRLEQVSVTTRSRRAPPVSPKVVKAGRPYPL